MAKATTEPPRPLRFRLGRISDQRYDRDRAIAESEAVFRLAMASRDARAALAAVELKAKLSGLLKDPRDAAKRNPLEDVPDDGLDERIRRLAAEAGFALVPGGEGTTAAGEQPGALPALPPAG